jgi:hypothetical protein
MIVSCNPRYQLVDAKNVTSRSLEYLFDIGGWIVTLPDCGVDSRTKRAKNCPSMPRILKMAKVFSTISQWLWMNILYTYSSWELFTMYYERHAWDLFLFPLQRDAFGAF